MYKYIYMHALKKKKKKKNVKRPDSPDVDREGGRPTKMWDMYIYI